MIPAVALAIVDLARPVPHRYPRCSSRGSTRWRPTRVTCWPAGVATNSSATCDTARGRT